MVPYHIEVGRLAAELVYHTGILVYTGISYWYTGIYWYIILVYWYIPVYHTLLYLHCILLDCGAFSK